MNYNLTFLDLIASFFFHLLTQRTSGEDSSRKSLTFSLVGNACKITWLLLGRKLLNYHQVFGRTALSNRLVGIFKKKMLEDMSSSQLFPRSKIIFSASEEMTNLSAILSISLTFFFEEWSCLHITPKFYEKKLRYSLRYFLGIHFKKKMNSKKILEKIIRTS